jgi:iron complex transport system ATP-binding protein
MSGREGEGVSAPDVDGSAVALDDVSLEIGGKRILSDVSWHVGRGEKWVILGLNGSGKTSLLRLLSGFGYPSSGALSVLGERFGHTDLRSLRKHVGWVYGDLALDFPGFMTCTEVVLSGGEGTLAFYDRISPAEARRAGTALEEIGAGHLAERRFHSLSTGERQRVLIARALAARPQLLLLDEPCQGLDPVAREDFLLSLGYLFTRWTDLTVICVTHHVEEIIAGFQRVLVLAGGSARAKGPRDEVMGGVEIARVYGKRCRIEYREGRYSMYFTGA